MSEYADDLAFPSSSNLLGETVQHPGMTLRDYFAAKAMQSLIVVYSDDKNLVDEYAQRAFEIADAMLEERQV